jgi:hypothetical protein
MRLWTTVDIGELPAILQNGLSNPYLNEDTFTTHAEMAADSALSIEGELAFLEVEVPDDQIEDYFVYCMGLVGDEASDMRTSLESMVEEGDDQDEIRALSEMIEAAENIDSATANLEVLGYACLIGPDVFIPVEWIKVLDPAAMLEAVHSGDASVIAQAVKTTEAKPLSHLGASFWVWLLFFVQSVLAGHPLAPSDIDRMARDSEKAEKLRARRRARRRKESKAGKAPKKKGARKKKSRATEV